MVEPTGRETCAYIAGDGEYDIEVEGTSEFQETLEWLGRGLGEEPTDYECTAVLLPDPDDPDDPDAISVIVLGQLVGYLPPDSGERMLRAMESWKYDYAKCEAVIGGGWYRNKDDRGDFQIWLDVNPHFKPLAVSQVGEAAVDTVALAPVQTAVVPVEVAAAPPPRRIGLTRREMGVAASTSIAILAAVGIAWLLVPSMRAPSSTASEPDTVMASSTPDLSDQERLEAKVAQRDFSPVVVSPPAVAALTARAKAMEPVPARRESIAEIRPLAASPDRPATAAIVPASKPQSGATVTGVSIAADQPSSVRSVPMTVTASAVVSGATAPSVTMGTAPAAVSSTIADIRPAPAQSQQTVAVAPPVVSRAGSTNVVSSTVALQSTPSRAAPAAPPDSAAQSLATPSVAAPSVVAPSLAAPNLAATNLAATSPAATSARLPAVQPKSIGAMDVAVTPAASQAEANGAQTPAARPASQDRRPAVAVSDVTHAPVQAEATRPSHAIAARSMEGRRQRTPRADRAAPRYRSRTTRSTRVYRPRRWTPVREREEVQAQAQAQAQATPRIRQLRPGETMASRLFEDGMREWAEKGPPSMFLPPPPRY